MPCLRPAFVLAMAVASAASACAATPARPAAVIAYRDLDLRSPEDRQRLNDRIDKVANELCRKEAEDRQLGEHFNRFNPGWCVKPTRKAIAATLPADARKI
ncbi:UrcA family protein [Sphingopyxis sp. OAS728]|nr:UrcA family protein [Sphingopyxis sp. OAS728]